MSASPDADLPVLAHTGRSPIGRPLGRSGRAEVSADRSEIGQRGSVPAMQAAALAAGGFAAGAAAVRLATRRRERALARKGRGRPLVRSRRRSLLRRRRTSKDRARGATVLEIVGSRSLLVDVHLLGSSRD